MDKYLTGREVGQNTSFPKCKALMFNNSTAGAITSTVYLYTAGTQSGGTFAVSVTTPVNSQFILPIQCGSIGSTGATGLTVTALY